MSKLLQKARDKFSKGNSKGAKILLQRLLAKKPNSGEANSLMGSILLTEKKPDAALKYLTKAIASETVEPCWYANYANALHKTGSYKAADKGYRLAELSGCTSKEFFTAYGRFLYNVLKDYQKAEICFAKIISQHPDYYPAYVDLGNVYSASGQFDKTIQVLEHCINAGIKDAAIYSNIGLALSQQGRCEECLQYFEESLKLVPNNSIAVSNYILNMLNLYDDQNYLYSKLTELVKGYNQSCVMEFSGDIIKDKNRKIRLGFVSADFYNHAIANYISPILASFDKEQFSLHLYYNNRLEDHITSALFKTADSWFNCTDVNTDLFEKQIREDKIDILIDLSNHTKGHRLDVFCRKPAPLLVSFMGLPISTGLKNIDYSFATDYLIEQCNLDENSSEKVWALPWKHKYMHLGQPPTIHHPPFLKNNFITFGSFNGLRKMNTPLIKTWSDILHQVPDSKLRLVIHDKENPDMQNYVYGLFEKHDIDRERLILVGRVSINEYAKSHNDVDIALDSYPYNGVTTTFYTLLMGVPLISCRGKSITSNNGYIILSHLNKQEWVAENLEQYVELAVQLANNPDEIISVKESLRPLFLQSEIMNHAGYTRNLEKALVQMWEKFCDEG